MFYFKNFNTVENYDTYIDGPTDVLEIPLISVINETHIVKYDPYPHLRLDIHTFDNNDGRGLLRYTNKN